MTTRDTMGNSASVAVRQMLKNARDDQIERLLRDIGFQPRPDTSQISDAPHDQA